MCRRRPAPARRHEIAAGAPFRSEPLETGPKLLGGSKPAAGTEIHLERGADRRRDVAGNGIDRLDLAPIAAGASRVEEDDRPEAATKVVTSDHASPAIAKVKLGRPHGRHI